MSDNSYQLNIFNFDKEHYKITKPIRLIELFAGIGAQAKALEILGAEFEHYKICEWAAQSIKAYNAIHLKDFTDYSVGKTKNELIEYLQGNISVDYNAPCDVSRKNEAWLRETYNNCIATHNLMNIMKTHGKDLEIVDTDKYEYVMTYSFPCTDLSLAGNQQGMAKGSGTRSGLLWEVERILDEVENKPQILLMENVPEVIGQKNVKHFNKWLAKLESLGYSNFFQILNSKNYGIPQNRKRCFMVSILGEYAYDFPLKIKLEYRLKDFLEKQVDEKYYLSDKMLNYISQSGTKNFKVDTKINMDVARPLTTEHNKRSGTTNYIAPDLPANFDLKVIGNTNPSDNFIEVFDFRYDEGIRGRVDNNLSPTITTKVGSKGLSGQPFIKVPQATKHGYAEAEEGGGVYLDRPHQKRGVVQKGISPTIKTQGRDIGVVVHSNNKRLNETADKIIDQDTQVLDCYNKTLHKKVAPTITTRVDASNSTFLFNKLRIRKLTPKECLRLMGFEDSDYYAINNIGLSNSAIYHCAGDSIVTTCLMGLFGKMLLNDKEVNNKIKEYVESSNKLW